MQKKLGGDRLGSGNKMTIEMHEYARSTHDLSYIWRSTMSAGTLVPFMSEIALPGDTFDIHLDVDVKTHPTIGPLFGTYKIQLDVFQAPIRLYNALLHNNQLGIGLNMNKVLFPMITLTAFPEGETGNQDQDNSQINPSCILSYLGIRGIGTVPSTSDAQERDFNAIPILAYWEIYKNYYANKQEEIGAVLHTPSEEIVETIASVHAVDGASDFLIGIYPSIGSVALNNSGSQTIELRYTGTVPIPSQIIFQTTTYGDLTAQELVTGFTDTGTALIGDYNFGLRPNVVLNSWRYKDDTDINTGKPSVQTFPLENIDQMRKDILAFQSETVRYNISEGGLTPYMWLTQTPNDQPNILSNQEGLALKTYQSDLFNNWLQTEWIDGTNGITAITAIDTSDGSFTLDTLNLSKKVYDMLNRIAVSGGSYDDWLDAVYTHERYTKCESPMYMGGLIRELMFQEVVSNSQSEDQPLGTLAGKGVMGKETKGGNITIKVDEPSYIIGIISLTPRIDYSQGNKWDINLINMDDLHKPALDEIGFQELITEQMAWWDTQWDETELKWQQRSAGKQPAWMNYMTNVNQVRGNFAIQNNEMFMTLNRRYEYDGNGIKDLTTYIDPSKYNFIFAETALDSQNFWTQIGVNITARRKMSAKIMPNL